MEAAGDQGSKRLRSAANSRQQCPHTAQQSVPVADSVYQLVFGILGIRRRSERVELPPLRNLRPTARLLIARLMINRLLHLMAHSPQVEDFFFFLGGVRCHPALSKCMCAGIVDVTRHLFLDVRMAAFAYGVSAVDSTRMGNLECTQLGLWLRAVILTATGRVGGFLWMTHTSSKTHKQQLLLKEDNDVN